MFYLSGIIPCGLYIEYCKTFAKTWFYRDLMKIHKIIHLKMFAMRV